MPEIEIDEEDIIVCAGCGIAIDVVEVAFEFDGRFVDYIEHSQGIGNVVFCPGCRNKLKENLEMPKLKALERRMQLMNASPSTR